MKITIVDDNVRLSNSVKRFFEKQGYQVKLYHSRKSFMEQKSYESDVYLLDIDLKDGNGLDIARYLRLELHDESPILMISGYQGLKTKLEGFDIGVDDYIVKPFSPLELEARVKSVIGRIGGNDIVNSELLYKDISFNKKNRTLKKGEVEIELSKKEKQIVELFLEKPGVFISKDILISRVWGNKYDPDNIKNTINVSICKVRKKMGQEFALDTINGEGYILNL